METNVLEKAAEIAKASLTKIEAPAKAKAVEAESKAAADNAKVEEAKKSEGIKLVEQAEAKTREDERILGEDDTKLSDTDKKRKIELLDIKRKEDDTPEAKIKRVQESTQKRIDEIKSEQMAKENKTAAELAALKAELEELKKPKQVEDALAKSKREESERIVKYIDEDKSKPKEYRREMSKDELDGWYLEDPVAATTWINERTYRRIDEKKRVEVKPDTDTAKKLADEFFQKQNESKAKLFAKYPKANISKEKISEVKTKLGLPLDRLLTEPELNKINDSLSTEIEEFRLCREICAEDPKKYIESVNGPELVMAEIEKRMKNTGNPGKNGKIELTQEELDAKIQAEIERRKFVDGEGINSSHGGKKVETQKEKSELRQKQEAIAKRAKISIEDLDKSITRRSGIPGASSGGAED